MHNGHNADNSSSGLSLWPQYDAVSQLGISTPFKILIEFEASEYYIQYSSRIPNFEDIRFASSEISDSSLP